MYGHKSEPSKRYTYGAKTPENLDVVKQQIFLANKYRNELVENEKFRRSEIQRVRKELYPELDLTERKIESLCAERATKRDLIKLTNQKFKRKIVDKNLNKEIKDLGEEIKRLSDQQKKRKKSVSSDVDLHELWKQIEVAANDKSKELYAKYGELGLDWGTRLVVRDNRVKRTGPEPRFHRFTGEGSVAVQIQNNSLSVAELMNGKNSSRVRIVQEDKEHQNRFVLYFAVGSEGQNKPIWAKVPFLLHRPLPPNAQIKWVELVCKRVGTHFKWEVQFVVSQPVWNSVKRAQSGRVAMDVGWRKVEKGIRVACWHGSDGNYGSIIIPNEYLARWKKVEDLQSIRSKNYNDILPIFVKWLKSNVKLVPEWLRARITTISHWRSNSQNKLASILIQWRDNHFSGDEKIFETLESWRKQDKHLYDWQESQRKNNIRWRDYFYRQEILALRNSYAEIGFEDLNWANLQKGKNPEEVDLVNNTNRNVASVGRFLEVVKETGAATKLDAKNSSRICHLCKNLCDPDPKMQFHVCEECGNEWDRDENAPINLLNRWPESGEVLKIHAFP